MNDQNNNSPTEASKEELEKLFAEAYGEAAESDNSEFTQVGLEREEKEESNRQEQHSPPEEDNGQGEEGNEGGEGNAPPASNQQEGEEEDSPYSYLESLDEEAREKVIAHMRKLENERKAAVGRSAYFQRKFNLQQNSKNRNGSSTGDGRTSRKEFQPPKTKEEWNALLEADPQAAKAFESRIQDERDALLKHIREEIEQEYAPIKEAFIRQQNYQNAWIEDQTRIVYEAVPDLDNILESREWGQWKAAWEQRSPGFSQRLAQIHHAYGDEQNPGIVDILSVFQEEVYGQAPSPTPARGGGGVADKAVKARQERQRQSPPDKSRPAAVSTRKEKSMEELFEEAMNNEMRAKGLL